MKLFDLYNKIENEQVFPFTTGNGFSVVRKYSDNKFKDYVLLIRVEIDDLNYLSGDVTITKQSEDSCSTGYRHLSEEEIPKSITNYSFNKEFIYKNNSFYNIRYPNKPLDMNGVVNVLIYNHLKGIGRTSKLVNNYFWTFLLWVAYFMVDKRYSYKSATDEMVDKWIDLNRNQNKNHNITVSKAEPFLKYFKIYKNQLLVFLILCGVCLIANFYCEKTGITISDFPDITNSGVVIFAFLCLYILEKTSMFFAALFNSVKGKNSIIENWINKINNFSFTLKVK